MHPLAPSQDKVELRRWTRERLERLSGEERALHSRDLQNRLRDVPLFATGTHILTCLSFGSEVDTWALVDCLVEEEGRAIYVPRCQRVRKEMTVHQYPCELETLSFGLRQPVPSAPAMSQTEVDDKLDCVLVLGIAFDPETGCRLGSGGGYFDRFLARHRVPTIALAFEEQIVRGLPSGPHDVPMDVIVTERAIYSPGVNRGA